MGLDCRYSEPLGGYLLKVSLVSKKRGLLRGGGTITVDYYPVKVSTVYPERTKRDFLVHVLSGGVLVDSCGTALRFSEMDWQELRVDLVPLVEDNS